MTDLSAEADHIRRVAAKFRNIVDGVFEDAGVDPGRLAPVEAGIKQVTEAAQRALRVDDDK